MKYLEVMKKLEKLTCSECDLEDVEITSNKINGVSVLICKTDKGKVFDCIVLSDEKYTKITNCKG